MTVAAVQADSAASVARTGLADNYELFLGLLTQQLQNQDPLDPMDSNQFVSQLVEFSSVEQQISQNENLETLIALQSSGAESEAVAYIGRDAAVAGGAAELNQGRAAWSVNLEGSAAAMSARIRNAEGAVVYEETLGPQPAGAREFGWDGRNNAGAQQPDGLYTLEIEAIDADQEPVGAALAGFARVTGVELGGDAPVLLLGDLRAALSDLRFVREPR